MERAIVLAAFRKAAGDVLTLPTPSYKQLPKGAKKDALSKRTIIRAQRSNKRAAAAYFKQYVSYKERTDYLAARRNEEKLQSLDAKLARAYKSLEKSKVLARKLLQNTWNAHESAVFLEQTIKAGNIRRNYKKYMAFLDQKEFLKLNMVATKAAVDVQLILMNASKFLKRFPEIGKIFIKFAAAMDPEMDGKQALEDLHKQAEKGSNPYTSAKNYAKEFQQHREDVQGVSYDVHLDEEVRALMADLDLDTEESEIQPAQNLNDPNGEWYVICSRFVFWILTFLGPIPVAGVMHSGQINSGAMKLKDFSNVSD